MRLHTVHCIVQRCTQGKRKESDRVHLTQMSRLELMSDGVSLKSPSPSAAEVRSGLCWNFAVSEKIAGPVP